MCSFSMVVSGWVMRYWPLQQQGVEGVASVAGSPGGVSNETEDDEEWPDEEATEEMEVAGGYPGQSFAEEDDGFGG